MKPPAFSLTAVVNEFPAPSQTFIQRKLVGLANAGVDVTVAASHFRSAMDRDTAGLHRLPLTPWNERLKILEAGNRSAIGASLAAVLAPSGRLDSAGGKQLGARERFLLGPLLASRSDIVHFEFSGIAVSYRHALRRSSDTKIAISCRGAAEQIVPLRDPSRGPLLHEVFEAADLIHCVSDDIRRTVESLGAPPERILVNRPAIPVAQFKQIAERRTEDSDIVEPRILSIGRLHWKKGFDDALKAIRSLSSSYPNLEYRIAGEGAEREKLSFLIEEYGLQGRVRLLGTCTQDQIREELSRANMLLLPSLSEGISNAVLEAMSSGLAVVSTNCGGMEEVIEDGVDGFIVDAGDTDAMAHRLSALASDPDLRARIADAAVRRAEADFDVSRQIRLFMDAYQHLLSC